MTPTVLHAEFDYFQAAIIVLAVIYSFVKWLWETWTGERQANEILERQEKARETRRDIKPPAQPAKPPPLPQKPLPTITPPWEELRKAWKEIREAKVQPAKPAPVTRSSPAKRQAAPTPAPAPPIQAPIATSAQQHPITAGHPTPTPANSLLGTLHQLRGNPAAMRQAIILSEVLGPPKALT